VSEVISMKRTRFLGSMLGLAAVTGAVLASLSGAVLANEEGSPSVQAWRSELASRYDVASWPGKGGPVVAGIAPSEIASAASLPLALDRVEWLTVGDDERVLRRDFTTRAADLTIAVAVARSCDAAHQVLFDHLARPRSMMPLDPPALPYGCVRLGDLGDVAFALPASEGDGYVAVEFVRGNVVVLLRAEASAARGVEAAARSLDATLRRLPAFESAEASGRWPRVERFASLAAVARAGDTIPLDIRVADPAGTEPLLRAFELDAGGILEEAGSVRYHAEAPGHQVLTLLVANDRGLAASARQGIDVVKR
jgi:hypothetical protein